jgi:hypothetical protein
MISVIIQIRQFRYCYRLTTQGVWYRSSFWSDSSDTVIDLQQRVVGSEWWPISYTLCCKSITVSELSDQNDDRYRSDSSDTVIYLQQRVYDMMISVIIQIRQFRYCYRLFGLGCFFTCEYPISNFDIFVVILLLNCNVIAKTKCDNSSCWQWCAVTQ